MPVATAMIDRLVRHAEVISLRGDSFRMRGRDLGRVPPAETSSND
ncbi:ATP-binding protein [Streptomyces albireticuli]|nr:ATP-binding protein [Streptomyces albireticuli]